MGFLEKCDAIALAKTKDPVIARSLGFDAEDYKNRDLNKLNNERGIGTRYHKPAVVSQGGVVLASILLRFRLP